jgi:hypothetical protein
MKELPATLLIRVRTAACSAHANLASNAWQRTVHNALRQTLWLAVAD